MATIQFQPVLSNVNGDIWEAVALATGDITSDLNINQGDAEVAVQLTGALGGATVSVLGVIAGATFSNIDDAFGDSMVYTSIGTNGIVKPVGPALASLRVSVVGGSGVSINVGVYVPSRKG